MSNNNDTLIIDESDSGISPKQDAIVNDSLKVQDTLHESINYTTDQNDFESQSPKKEKYFGCYSSKRSCRKWSLIIGLSCAFLLGLILFFVWPRATVFQLLPIPKEGQQIQFNQEGNVVDNLQSASASNPFGVWASFRAPVSVQSDNYISFEMRAGEMQLSINSPSGPLTQFVLNGVLPNSMIYGRTNNTITANVTVTLNLVQGVNPENVNKELQYLASVCTGTDKYLQVNYKLTAEIPSLAWLGIRPTGKGILNLQCPEIIVQFGKNTTKATTKPSD